MLLLLRRARKTKARDPVSPVKRAEKIYNRVRDSVRIGWDAGVKSSYDATLAQVERALGEMPELSASEADIAGAIAEQGDIAAAQAGHSVSTAALATEIEGQKPNQAGKDAAIASTVATTVYGATREETVGRLPKSQRDELWVRRDTAGDRRVCPVCEKMDGDVAPVSKWLSPRVPLHPNCRCSDTIISREEALIAPERRPPVADAPAARPARAPRQPRTPERRSPRRKLETEAARKERKERLTREIKARRRRDIEARKAKLRQNVKDAKADAARVERAAERRAKAAKSIADKKARAEAAAAKRAQRKTAMAAKRAEAKAASKERMAARKAATAERQAAKKAAKKELSRQRKTVFKQPASEVTREAGDARVRFRLEDVAKQQAAAKKRLAAAEARVEAGEAAKWDTHVIRNTKNELVTLEQQEAKLRKAMEIRARIQVTTSLEEATMARVLSTGEADAIRNFVGNEFVSIRKHQMGILRGPKYFTDDIAKRAGALERAIASNVSVETELWRGIVVDEAIAKKLLARDSIDWLGATTSTSTSRSVAERFAAAEGADSVGILFRVKRGRGMPIQDIGLPSEREVLQSGASRFKVLSKRKEGEHWVVELEHK